MRDRLEELRHVPAGMWRRNLSLVSGFARLGLDPLG
jgi:hypothetical protein